jgi:uncharacterized protein YmfQ (DUF2313 family)
VFGGYAPYPRRFGVGRPRLQIIHDVLNAGRGTALDASNQDTIAWVENMAYARAICFDGYGTNDRIANQRDPDRMTDMLPRWEKICGITPAPGATDRDRRLEVRKRFRRFLDASALHSRLFTRLKEELGPVFGAIEYIDPSIATIYVPNATYPWGTVQPGYLWYSTVCHILVLLVKPDSYTEGDFFAAASKVLPAVDSLLPAWVSLNWYRKPSTGAPVNVSGGPSQAGFYLDNPANLDCNCLSV